MRLPQHVAIIMDGNGRWAKARGLPRSMGHRRGVEAVREAVRTAGEAGIRYLTLFAFSSENWRRPAEEVDELMGLLKLFIRRDLADLHKEGVRVRIIGARENLKSDILSLLEEAENLTRHNDSTTLVIAFNYGAREEMARAMRRIAVKIEAGELSADAVSESVIDDHMDTAGIPDP
ncbi:MAG: di-trans,poly-cis-decaprenylcistransferase, partial [Rhizobiaceae bacterium]|nr:di-trans,poly-cis-decaprenylcistransferase [Rhizobiaceae bacterium]